MLSVKQDRTVDELGLGMEKLKPKEEQGTPQRGTPQQDLGQEGPEQSFSPGGRVFPASLQPGLNCNPSIQEASFPPTWQVRASYGREVSHREDRRKAAACVTSHHQPGPSLLLLPTEA